MITELPIVDFIAKDHSNIWDVRDADAYRQGHIAGAINQPLSEGFSPELLAQSTGTIYVLCGGGSKAPKAAEIIKQLDTSRDVVVLTGGTRGAVAAGMPLVIGDAPFAG